MDQKERVELIRKGNELFNKGDVETAAKVFVKTAYKDGIARVADYYFFEKRRPLNALPYYKMVNRNDKVQEIYDRMLFALGKMLKMGTSSEPAAADESVANTETAANENEENRFKLPPLKVSPKLKILAEEILAREDKA